MVVLSGQSSSVHGGGDSGSGYVKKGCEVRDDSEAR